MQTVVDRTILPSVVNTQILSPLKNADPAVKIAFPGVNVNDREQANVRPPTPSLCVGNGFIVETTDLVSWHHPHLIAYTIRALLTSPFIAFQPLSYSLLKFAIGVGAMACIAGLSGLTIADEKVLAVCRRSKSTTSKGRYLPGQ